MGPLSSWTYGLIASLFGRSQLTYELLSLFVVFFQCFLFNRLLLRNKAYNENTYVPGLIYAILISYFFDFFTLSPVLIGITFILLALDHIFAHIEVRANKDEKILNIGMYFGLASLFYLPFIVFLPATLLMFIFFTGTVLRRYILILFGYMLPFLLIGCYFLIVGRLNDLIYNFLFSALFDKIWYVPLLSTIIIFSIPLIYLIISWVTIAQRARMTNYQSRLSQSMLIWFLFSLLFIIISDVHTPYLYQIMVPVLGYYLSHYFLLFKRKFLAEISFTILFISMVLINYGTYFDFFFTSKHIDVSSYTIGQSVEKPMEEKSILVLGEDLTPYYKNQMATPFLSWKLSKRVFSNLEYYDNLTVILAGFKGNMPAVIIDEENILPDVFEKIPYLKERYIKQSETTYVLISN